VSVAAPSPPPSATPSVGGPGATSDAPAEDSCPLCGAPLDPNQDWCLRCGAAARTRLAASSSWKAPLIAGAVVAALALAVLAAALVKLVSDANSHARNTVVVVQTPAPATPTTAAPGTKTPSPRAAAPRPRKTASARATAPVHSPPISSTARGRGSTPVTLTPAARARLSVPEKRRITELEVRLRRSTSAAEQQRLRRIEERIISGR
jgi:hypothetical protein